MSIITLLSYPCPFIPQIIFEIVIAILFSKLHRYRSGNFHELDENKKETENKSGKLMIGK